MSCFSNDNQLYDISDDYHTIEWSQQDMTSPLEPQSLTISGVEVLFPYKPYDIQLDYMKSVIHCLQQVSRHEQWILIDI